MVVKLTIKQENFCQEYLLNGNATQAYKNAYNCSKMKDTTINNNSYMLLQNSEIIARLKELQQPLQEKFSYTVEDSFKNFLKVQELALQKQKFDSNGEMINDPDLTNYIKAEELKGKLLGLYKEQIDISGELKTNINIKFI